MLNACIKPILFMLAVRLLIRCSIRLLYDPKGGSGATSLLRCTSRPSRVKGMA
jgi:hypothetical protein